MNFDGLKLTIENIKEIFIVENNSVQKVNEKIFLKLFGKENHVKLDNILDSFYYFYYKNDKLYFTKNIKFLKNNKFKLEEDRASKYMFLELGYVLPPFTVFKDVYRIFPYSNLTIENQRDKFNFNIQSIVWDLKFEKSLDYKDALNEFEKILRNNLVNIIGTNKNVLTLSGGADSSLLLKLSENYLKKDRDLVITVESPGQKEELLRSKKLCKDANQSHKIIDSQIEDYEKISKLFVENYNEPISDPIAPLEYKIVKENSEIGTNVIEGQAADSLYLGLPHNLAFNLYRNQKKIYIFYKVLASVLNKFKFDKSTSLGRTLYRIKKISNSFKQNNDFEFLVNLLGLQKIFENKDQEYIERFEKTIKKLSETYDGNYVIAYFFMYRILPVREMQKYRLLAAEGYEFSFPYIEGEAMEFFQKLPKEFLTKKGERKKIIFDLCKKCISDIDFKGKTTPFYIKTENDKNIIPNEYMSREEIDKANDINAILDNIKNYKMLNNIF